MSNNVTFSNKKTVTPIVRSANIGGSCKNRKKELPLLNGPVWVRSSGVVGCQQMVATTCSFWRTFPFFPYGAVDWMHACIRFYTSKLASWHGREREKYHMSAILKYHSCRQKNLDGIDLTLPHNFSLSWFKYIWCLIKRIYLRCLILDNFT